MKETLYATILILAVFFAFLRGAFVNESSAVRHLENLGFSEVTITKTAWFVVGLRGCSEKDAAKFSATATNPAGNQVEVEVCVGWPFKGATLRS